MGGLFKNSWLSKYWFNILVFIILTILISQEATAAGEGDIGQISKNITKNFENLTRLITAAAYMAGIGFSVSAIMKFKQHKDNPTQVTIGTPIGLVFIAAALLFLPSILSVTSRTIFGSGGGKTGGFSGTVFKNGD